MADNGNREPNDTFRRAGGKKRREPPIIDASATEVPVEPSRPAIVPEETVSSETAEPVLFGSAMRDSAQRSRETAGEPAPSEPARSGDAMVEPPAEPIVSDSGADSETVSSALPPDPSSGRDGLLGSGPDALPPPAFQSPGRSGLGIVPGLLGLVVLVLLGTVAWLLYTGPQRSGRDELAGTLADLQTKVAALEARPDPGQMSGSVADLDKRVGAADADRSGIAQAVAQLTKRVDGIDQQVQTAKAAADAKPAEPVTPPAAESKPEEPAFATLAAVAALAGKVDAIDGRLDGLASDQGGTAKALADLPKPAPVDLAPVQGRIAGAEATLNGLDSKVNGSDARLNGFDAKINGIDGKVNGFDARMNGFDARVNGIEAKANDVAALEGKLQSTVADLPKVDLQPLQTAVASLDDRVGKLQSTVADLPKIDLQPLQAAVTSLDDRLGKLQTAVADLPKVDLQPLQAADDALAGRITKMEADLSAAKNGARVTEARAVGSADESRAAPIAVVGQAVQRAIADGRPYASDVAALKALGGEPEAVARLTPLADTGAPSVETLKSQWDDVKGNVLAAIKPGQSTDPLDRFAASARALVQVKRVGIVTGSDPVAVASQVDEALDRGDVAEALTVWSKLPEAGREVSQAWADTAKARLDAEVAARDLVSRAIATLGRAKG